MREWGICRLSVPEGSHHRSVEQHAHLEGGDESGAVGTDDVIDITNCGEDMRGLWANGAVGVALKKREIWYEDSESPDVHLSLITHHILWPLFMEMARVNKESVRMWVVEDLMSNSQRGRDDPRSQI